MTKPIKQEKMSKLRRQAWAKTLTRSEKKSFRTTNDFGTVRYKEAPDKFGGGP